MWRFLIPASLASSFAEENLFHTPQDDIQLVQLRAKKQHFVRDTDAQGNSDAQCAIAGNACTPCNICFSAATVDLSNVAANNLGGVGPNQDDPQEIRYQNAINLNGQMVDVVLVAQNAYTTPKPQNNGYKDGGFGRFTLQVGTSTNLNFLFQDSSTLEPVVVPNIAFTVYDMDEGQEANGGRQRETITACAADQAFTTTSTELIFTDNGGCKSFQSSVIGDGSDNPTSTAALTSFQAGRSVTYQFSSKSSFGWTAALTGSQNNPRPILFSFAPSVACGASDAQDPCVALPYHWGGAGDNECRPQSVSQADCLSSVQNLLTAGQTQGRTTLQLGDWTWVPPGCSAQSGGDWAAHFNTAANGVNDGSYTTVCTGQTGPPLDMEWGDAGSNTCRPTQSVSQADCLAAVQAFLPAGQVQGRTNLQLGNWGWVPPGCSTQSGGDWAAHFNTGDGTNDGSYTPVPQMSTNEDNCLYTVQALLPAGTVQGRRELVAGSWDHVPPGCSTQSGGDWAAHFNRRGTGINDGSYTLTCKPS